MTRSQLFFHRFAWSLIPYTLLVVLWGAFVRASKSGDGCGAHWPTCNGEVLPTIEHAKTWVEFAHRGTSGLLWIATFALLLAAFRFFPKGHRARLGAVGVFVFTSTEGLIGAKLVLAGLVADNSSVSRAIWLALHLLNTFTLLGWLAFTAWSSRLNAQKTFPRLQWKEQGVVLPLIALGLLLTLWVSTSGVVAALGDTLFPSKSLQHALQQDFSPTAHILIRLRFIHPTIAIITAIFLVVMTALLPRVRTSPTVAFWAKALATLFCFQLGFGLLNVLFLAPIWMQIVHLAIADTIWLCLLMMSFCALAEGVPQTALGAGREALGNDARVSSSASAPAPSAQRLAPTPPLWKDYLLLTKPRVISLLLFTTWTAMVMAARGWPGTGLFLLTGLGFYMAAGAAHAINMVIDSDIDRRTIRTATRPVAAGRIAPANALIFAAFLAAGSFLLLWQGANLLSALMALSGLAFYVVVYTLVLKRRTWSNIVIGGAAGSFPPLVGWAAVSNQLTPLAWLLFGIIFLWTPVHFWALAILIKDDYAKNGIPMLPVVKGERATAWQIIWYALLTMAISLAPFVLKEDGGPMAGWIYLMAALLLNGVLVWRCLLLYREPAKPRASGLFHYSMVYLFLLFLALAVDRAVI